MGARRRAFTFLLLCSAGVAAVVAPRLIPRAEAIDPVAVAEPDPEPEPVTAPPEPEVKRRDVDLVIALDTSGSMDGLLDSARARLWDVVSRVSEQEPNARLRVALITFGSPEAAGADVGYVALRSGLVTDLDTVYAQLMALRTDGGDEYVGWALDTALHQLAWSESPDAARIVFVAGNEGADQGRNQRDFRTVTTALRERGVVVNAIYAGHYDAGVHEGWKAVAEHGRGVYSAIDMHRATVQVATPQDDRLRALNEALNATYLAYGREGEARKQMQEQQDANASGLGSYSLSSRVSAKATAQYDNRGWDLVDGVKSGKVDLDATEALPEPLRPLPAAERRAYVDGLEKKRAEIQAEIKQAEKDRRTYLDAVDDGPGNGLDEALVEALAEQL